MKKLLFLLVISFHLLAIGFSATAQSLSVATTIVSNVSCYGGSNGSINATPSGGTTPYTYLWSPGSQTNQTASNLIAVTYTILVTDHLGTTVSASVNISQPTALSITAWATYSAVCGGQPDSLFVSGTGGTIPYNYHWSAPFDDISNPSGDKTNSYPYGAAYIVSAVNDLNGCTASASVSITVHTPPLVSIAGPINPIAPSRSDTLVASALGATSYLWSNSATTSSIIVSPSVSTTYSLTVTNMFSCYDTTHYTIDTNTIGDGKSNSTAIWIVPSTNVTTGSYSSMDSVVWFKFISTDSNNQIIATSPYLGMPVPHTHRLTLYDNSLSMLVDQFMPDITGASQLRIDISHLHIGSTYYLRASRCPAHANMVGCNPSASGECNASQRWDFQMCFRTVPVFVPQDSGSEPPATAQLYYESRGQIPDLNNIPRFDIKAYTNNTKPAVFCSDSGVSFVYQHVDTAKSFIDTIQRVDMVLTGSGVQPAQPVFKMEEDSGAGYLNYFLGYVPNGVPQVEGYSRLVYKNVYSNIDMHVYSNSVGTKLYFVCNPTVGTSSGGNPANIELQFKGATSVSATGGSLKVNTELGTLNFAPGFAYTDSAGIIKPKSWQAYFIAVNSNTVRFNTGAFNSNEPFIIEVDRGHKAIGSHPAQQNLDWSTYFGGIYGQDLFNDVCSDAAGNVYATGVTQSILYPVTIGVVQSGLLGGMSATLAKFSNSIDSDKRVWATYYGGYSAINANGVALDASGNIYIAGYAQVNSLPLASRPSSLGNYLQPALVANIAKDSNNAFITMFSNDGRQTHWATYYGGGGSERGQHIAIDGDTNIYVVGGGASPAVNSYFPIQKSSHAGAYNDSTYGTGFIVEFNASHAFSSGIKRVWATRIGDSLRNNGTSTYLYGCTVDNSNNFYVTGYALDKGYTSPATLTFPYQGPGGSNAVLTKFNANNHVVWSSYYGGSGPDWASAIAVDKSGNVYITGNTRSDSSYGIGIQTKPFGAGYFQRSNLSTADGFIAEFSSSGRQKWGTYFGETVSLTGQAITIDNYNNLYITGLTEASSLPFVSNPAGVYNQTSFVSGKTSDNAFIASFSNADTNPAYVWGSYFGNDQAFGMCITHYTGHNWLYIVGNLGSGNTPLVFPKGSYQQDTFYYSELQGNPEGTSFISQFDINPIIGPAGISNINTPTDGILVYPNPTAQNITLQINLPASEDVQVSVMDLLGETVYTASYKGEQGIFQQQVPLASLSVATYIIKVQTKNNVYYNKIVKLQ